MRNLLSHHDQLITISLTCRVTAAIMASGKLSSAGEEPHVKRLQKGRYLLCPNGSHMAMYDDQKTYFEGLIKFVQDVSAARF